MQVFPPELAAALLALLTVIAGGVLRMVYMLGGSLQRLEEHDRRIGSLESWRNEEAKR